MLILASATDKLQLSTSAAGNINCHASYLDNVSGTVAPGRQNTNITTAATTDVVSPPASSVYRNLKTLHVYNAGAAAQTVTVQHTDGTTVVQLHQVNLSPGSTLQYIDEVGFLVGPAAKTPTLGGLLSFVSATQLKFAPYGGSYIRLNGVLRPIPSSGIAGLANTGVRVNGVAGQNLVVSTAYLVFCTDVGGVLTADFRTGVTHGPSTTAGNEGTEVMIQSALFVDTESLIGICYVDANAHFQDSITQRFVRSWLNRRRVPLQGPQQSVSTEGFSSSGAILDYGAQVEFVCFPDDAILMHNAGFNSAATPYDQLYVFVYVDGAGFGGAAYSSPPGSYLWDPFAVIGSGYLAEGHHRSGAGFATASSWGHALYWTINGTVG